MDKYLETTEIGEPILDFTEKDRTVRALRRKKTFAAKAKDISVCNANNKETGPYLHEGRAVNPGRGKQSKTLKKLCNRAVRRSDISASGGAYKKVADYWWGLI